MSDIKQDGFKLSEVLVAVKAVFDTDPKAREEQLKKVNGIFELRAKNAEGTEGVWTIDLKKDGTVTKGPAAKPDVVISATETLVAIAGGTLGGQKAYMTGKIKAKGNIMMATKLEGVLKASKPKTKGRAKL